MTTISTDSTRSDTSSQTHIPARWLLAARLIWGALAGLSIAAYVVARVGVLSDPTIMLKTDYASLYGGPPWAFWAPDLIIAAGYTLIGVFLMWRGPRDWLAMVVSFTLIGTGTLIANDTSGLLLAMSPGFLWPGLILEFLALAGLIAIIFLFPDGRFAPGWMRWLAILTLPLTAWTVYSYRIPGEFSSQVGASPLVPIGLLFVGLGGQVYRYRRVSSPAQRQQTKWVLVGLVAFLIAITLSETVFATMPDETALFTGFGPAIFVGYTVVELLLPAMIAVSIMRYRLWDIDFFINRSLIYGTLTLLLIALFGGSLLLVTRLFQDFAGGPLVAVAISAGVFGIAFNPLRRLLRAFVDKRLYGIEIDYATPGKGARQVKESAITSVGGYTGLEPIGAGGMAEVYRAMHPTLSRPVAVKVLPRSLSGQEEFRRRFEREAQVVAGLKHPNIVQMHDFGVDGETYYMVMEYVEGANLGQLIREQRRLPLEQAQTILKDIAAALDYAHGQGLVHRDIKPSNVMVEGRRAVLMDFGIARIATAMTRLTGTGRMVGTLDYIAPEQVQGREDIDGRADVYALGVMAYQMLTGELPFRKNNPGALMMAHLMEPPPDASKIAPDVPEGAAEAIIQALSKKPGERFKTAGGFVAALA